MVLATRGVSDTLGPAYKELISFTNILKEKLHRFSFCCRIVEFATYADMKNALEKLDDTEINGRRIRLIEDRPKKSKRRWVNIWLIDW